jgi:hypothetical protein
VKPWQYFPLDRCTRRVSLALGLFRGRKLVFVPLAVPISPSLGGETRIATLCRELFPHPAFVLCFFEAFIQVGDALVLLSTF